VANLVPALPGLKVAPDSFSARTYKFGVKKMGGRCRLSGRHAVKETAMLF
jgi:hypothetical protein